MVKKLRPKRDTATQLTTEILESILEINCDPEEACKHSPELLPIVLRKLEQMRRIDMQIKQLFPVDDDTERASLIESQTSGSRFPKIPGYEIEGVVGSGGMGVVYRARHRKLNRVVALKMLRAGQFATESELERFARESRAIAELHCPNIVQIHDVGDIDGQPYFTMELVAGGSLSNHLQRTPQSAFKAAETVRVLAEAIHSAHQKGIVHRDLKPANILMSLDGCPKIADFGLARHINCDHQLTMSGVLLGTPSYMAPEQILQGSNSVGPFVDIYALGAILYEMLTGRPPFLAESAMETQRQVTQLEPVPPSRINATVPRDLETICLKCLSKQTRDRYETALDLSADLARFLRFEPIHARAVTYVERSIRWMKRQPALFALIMSAVAFVSLTVVFGMREYRSAVLQQTEIERWKQRLEFVNRVEREGRFREARAILGRLPDGGSGTIRNQIQQAQRELDLVERLDSIRFRRGRFTQGGGIDYEEPARQYADAFRDWHIGDIGYSANDVARHVKDSSVRIALIAALDDWAACADAETRKSILEVSKIADPDPWRDQVRNQEKWADIDHISMLAESAAIGEQPVEILVAMGNRWRRLGGNPSAFLARVHRIYPEDFWLNFELALLYSTTDPRLSLGHNLAALAVRPDAALVQFNLGTAYENLKILDNAIFHFKQTIELDPNHSWAEYRLGLALANTNQAQESLAHFKKAITLDPTLIDARNALRMVYVSLEQLEEAAAQWERTLSDPRAKFEDLDGIAELQLFLRREAKYQECCEVLFNRFGGSHDALVCERLGRACLLKPKDKAMEQAANLLIDRAFSTLSNDQEWARPYLMFAKSLAEYRARHYENAVNTLKEDVLQILQPSPEWLRLMVMSHLEEKESLRKEFDRLSLQMNEHQRFTTRESWLAELLRREAESLIPRDQ